MSPSSNFRGCRVSGRPLMLACLVAMAGAPLVAASQESFPTRPITLVVPFAAGSGADIGARLLAKDLLASLGQAVVVDNKPGANGALGAQAAARARPDGHTLLIGSATTNAANFAFFPGKLNYEPASFEIVGGMASGPIALYVPQSSPWKTLADLMAEGRRADARLNCGSGNSVTQVACIVFHRQAVFPAAINVPYKSSSQVLTDVVGGQVAYAFADAAVAQVLVEQKKLRPLAVASAQRLPASPELETFIEHGLADFQFTAWIAVFVPAGTPAAVQEKLNAALRRAQESPEAVRARVQSGAVALDFGLAEARRFAQTEVVRWARYVKDSGIKPE